MNISEIQKSIKKIIDNYKIKINDLSIQKKQVISDEIKDLESKRIIKLRNDLDGK